MGNRCSGRAAGKMAPAPGARLAVPIIRRYKSRSQIERPVPRKWSLRTRGESDQSPRDHITSTGTIAPGGELTSSPTKLCRPPLLQRCRSASLRTLHAGRDAYDFNREGLVGPLPGLERMKENECRDLFGGTHAALAHAG